MQHLMLRLQQFGINLLYVVTLTWEVGKKVVRNFVGRKTSVLSDLATVAVILFNVRSVMSYVGLFDWIFIIYCVIFKLKVLMYTYITRCGDGANYKLPETIDCV